MIFTLGYNLKGNIKHFIAALLDFERDAPARRLFALLAEAKSRAACRRQDRPFMAGNDLKLDQIYDDQFVGMTEAGPPSIDVLLETRRRLRRDLMARLTAEYRRFLVGLADANPDWTLLANPDVQALPALRWKLANLTKFKTTQAQKCAAQAAKLELLLYGAEDPASNRPY